jgi:hypothetical protein
VKSFQDKDSFTIAKTRLTDFGLKYKTQELETGYRIVFKDNSKVDTVIINKLINSSGIIRLHKAVQKDSILLSRIYAETDKIEKLYSDIKQINDSLRDKKNEDIVFYKTMLNNQINSSVIGNNYKADYKKLNSILSSIRNKDIIFSSYLPYLSRDYEIYDLIAFEESDDYFFTSNMYESLDLILGNKRDYAEIKIKFKQEYSERFNMHQKENYKGKQVGFFIDDELFYCPTFGGYSVSSISMIFPTNESAKYAYSVLKTTQESSITKSSTNDNKLPDYYSDSYYPNIDSLHKAGVSMDELVLISANSILNTPDDDRINKRNDLLNFILDRFGNDSKWNSLMQDELARKFNSVNQMVWAYYLVCLSKSSVEEPESTEIELKTKAVSLLIDYVFNVAKFENKSIVDNEFLKELQSTKNKKELMIKLDGL